MKKSSKAFKIASYVIVVLLLVAVIGIIVFFTNGLTSDFKSFFGVVNGEPVLVSKDGVRVSTYNPLTVQVKYTFGWAQKEKTGYSIEISANEKFSYTVDGQSYSSLGDVEWEKCFDIKREKDSFEVRAKAECLSELLALLYPDSTVALDDEDVDYTAKDLFKLTVYSYDKKASFAVYFNVSKPIKSIELDKGGIIFA